MAVVEGLMVMIFLLPHDLIRSGFNVQVDMQRSVSAAEQFVEQVAKEVLEDFNLCHCHRYRIGPIVGDGPGLEVVLWRTPDFPAKSEERFQLIRCCRRVNFARVGHAAILPRQNLKAHSRFKRHDTPDFLRSSMLRPTPCDKACPLASTRVGKERSAASD